MAVRTGSHLIDAGLLLGPHRSNDLIRTWPSVSPKAEAKGGIWGGAGAPPAFPTESLLDSLFHLEQRLNTYVRTNFRIFGFLDFQIFRFLDFQIFRFSDFQIFGFSDFWIFGFSDFQIFGLSNFYGILLDPTGPYWTLLDPTGPYWTLLDLTGPY